MRALRKDALVHYLHELGVHTIADRSIDDAQVKKADLLGALQNALEEWRREREV